MATYLLFLFVPIAASCLYWYIIKDQEKALVKFVVSIFFGGIFVMASYAVQRSSADSAYDYNGYLVLKTEYYEYWDSWVEETCSTTTTDSKGNTTTTYYDCSYCDRNREYYLTRDSGNNTQEISKNEFERLKRIWGNKLTKVDLNRRIYKSGSCGTDGDMYYIDWNQDIQTSETTTYRHSYTNRIKYDRSAFGFHDVSTVKGLYNYPDILSYHRQSTVLGEKLLNIPDSRRLVKNLDYFNGLYGRENKIRIFTMFFINKPPSIGQDQKAKWIGGNQNELNVCIGLKEDGKTVDWVYVFTWQDDKLLSLTLQDEIQDLGTINSNNLYQVYLDNKDSFKYKDFEDFSYINFTPSSGQIWFVFIGVIIITIGCIIFIHNQE